MKYSPFIFFKKKYKFICIIQICIVYLHHQTIKTVKTMKTTIQIKADLLELILDEVKDMRKKDDSLSDTIEFTIIEQADTHLGSDRFGAELKSGYSECYGKGIILK